MNIQYNCAYELTGKISIMAQLKLLKNSEYDYIRINNGVVYSSSKDIPCAIDLIVDQFNPGLKDSITTVQIDQSNFYILVIQNKKILLSDIFSQELTDSKVRLYSINSDFKPALFSYGYTFKNASNDEVNIIKSSPFDHAVLKKYRFVKKSKLVRKIKKPIIVWGIIIIFMVVALCGVKIGLNLHTQKQQRLIAEHHQIVIDKWKKYKQVIFKVTPTEILPIVFKDAAYITDIPGVVVSSIDCSDKILSMELINKGNSDQLINKQVTHMGFNADITGMLFKINKRLSIKPNNSYFSNHIVSNTKSKAELTDYLSVVGGPVIIKQNATIKNENYSVTTFTFTFNDAPYDFIIDLFKSINNYPITFNTLTGRTVLTGFTGDISINLIGDTK